MKIVEMLMPPLGESILECTVLGHLKSVGDTVLIDDSVLEVATDKVDTEVPCPYKGILKEWLVNENDIVEIGSPVAKIEVEESSLDENSEPQVIPQLNATSEAAISPIATPEAPISSETISVSNQGNQFYSPLVLSIAKKENINSGELAGIQGTGADQRITKFDILEYVKNRASKAIELPNFQGKSISGESEIITMDRMRKMISQRMSDSRKISAHVTSFIETDMTPIVNWRESVKNEFRKSTGIGITFTPILIQAVAKAIVDFPMINISVSGDNIIKKKDINIGMAVALPDGNLIVPVIHHADKYSLAELAKKVHDLAHRARLNQLKADDLAGGTYTVSNIGAFANLMGTPIIVQPQVGIMAFGAIKKKPAVIETAQGDLIGIRSMMFASHSYDHRVVDGSLGGLFLKRVNDYLETFDIKQVLL